MVTISAHINYYEQFFTVPKFVQYSLLIDGERLLEEVVMNKKRKGKDDDGNIFPFIRTSPFIAELNIHTKFKLLCDKFIVYYLSFRGNLM